MDETLLHFLSVEFNNIIKSAVLRKVYEMEGGIFLLKFYSGENINLFIKLKDENRRIHLVPEKNGKAKTPSSFCMLLRKYIEGRRLISASCPNFEKRIIFVFTDGKSEWKLIAEFFSREGNLILLSSNDKVLGSYRTMPESRMSDKKDYIVPPYMKSNGLPDKAIMPTVYLKDSEVFKYSAFGENSEGLILKRCSTVNDMLYEFYKKDESNLDFDASKNVILQKFNKEKEKLNKKIEHIKTDLAKLSKNSYYHKLGELILTNLYKIKPKDAVLITENFYEDPPCEIEILLDPSLSGSDNAAQYFEKFKKYQRGVPILQKRLEECELEFSLILEKIESIKSAKNSSDLGDYSKSFDYQSKKAAKEMPAASLPRKYFYKDYEILAGRNPNQNDEISLKISNKTDLWFHTRGIPGSHVIIRVKAGEKTPKEVILRAAEIAAYFSKGKKSSKVSVSYTLAKNVSKKKGMPPGMVTISDETAIVVNPQNYDFQEWIRMQSE